MSNNDKKGKPDNTGLEKSTAYIIVEITERMANSVVIKTIIKKISAEL